VERASAAGWTGPDVVEQAYSRAGDMVNAPLDLLLNDRLI
jgi:hypothetical protein